MVTGNSGDASEALSAFSVVSAEHEKQAEMQRYLVHTMVRQLRAAGYSWRDIGRAAGISHVAAMKRWKGEPVHPARSGEYFGDPEDLVLDDERGPA